MKNLTRTSLVTAMLVAFVATPIAVMPAAADPASSSTSSVAFLLVAANCSECVNSCADACLVVESAECTPYSDGSYDCACRCRI